MIIITIIANQNFIIEERRRLVAKLWAQSKTETEIARELHCNVSTICRDIKFLKKLSQQFVFDLAKDLGFYYKGCIDTMDQIQQKCWNIYNNDNVSQKDKLLALKIIKETCESKFSLIEKGPSVMALNSLQERVEKIESHQIMNLDKTIKELTNRLDEVHPYSASSTNHQNRNDGINYWKGKKIISAKDWNELYEKNSTYTDTYTTTLTSRKPLQYFPDDYNGSISVIRSSR